MKKLLDVVKEKTGAGKVKPELKGFGKSETPQFVLKTFNEIMANRRRLRRVKDV
jgi:hypothetical protein